MTFREKLAAKVTEAQVAVTANKEEAMVALLDNPEFIETQRIVTAKEAELKSLNATITQLGAISKFKANDGTEYSVRVFPVAEGVFGTGIAQILGIISGSRGAFTDEMQAQFSAITKVPMIEIQMANIALGSPRYMKKDGSVVAAEATKLGALKPLLQSIALQLDIHEFDVSTITQNNIDLWFLKEDQRVTKQLADKEKTAKVDTKDFVLED
jgi:hypothetical protein